MSAWEYVLGAVLIVISIIMIIIVLMQQSKSEGLSGAIAGGAETFFGKNRGRTIEAKLVKVTTVLSAIFIVLALGTTVLIGFFG
ncbi:MAG: preprotein translocase subunit SecG [Clostridiales bacterium]|nr:preprotein translocase subunit SecG [Clostridiales bacterium]MCD7827699.1 preprotein translocase subunit SecG [Clostridiales bacterium]